MEINSNNTTQTNSTTSKKSNNQETQNTTSTFADTLSQKQTLQELYDDIFSLIRTGLTVSEYEQLQEYLAKIRELAKKDSNDAELKKEIESMIKAIEQAILQLQKRINGGQVVESSKDTETQNNNSSDEMMGFKARLDTIEKSIHSLQNLSEEKTNSKDKENKTLLNEITKNNLNIEQYILKLQNNISQNEVKDMIAKLEKEIEKLQERITGKKEVEVEDDLETQDSEGLTSAMKVFKSMVKSLENTLEEIKEDSVKNNGRTTTDEELKLIQQLKN